MSEIAMAHCRGNYLREFAHKTIEGIDKPNKEGYLLDLRRLRYKPIKNNEQLSYVVKKYSDRPGEYITVYSFEKLKQHDDTKKLCIDYSTAKINRIYFDFDFDGKPQIALNQAVLVMRELFKRNIHVHCYFSGNKGIAMYIEFKTMEIKGENKKDVLASFFDVVKEMVSNNYENWFSMPIPIIDNAFRYDLFTLDVTIRGDLARVSRIPNSKHKSGYYCIPLTPGDMYKGIDYIKSIAKEPRNIDLDDVITKNIMRNSKMNIILKNLEKQVIADREQDKIIQGIHKQRAEQFKASKNAHGAFTDEDVERVKAIPLSQLTGTSAKRSICQIHHGDNPSSFQVYPNKNTWFCHSCRQGGTTIDYVMLRDRVDFKTAVLRLMENI